MRYTASRHTEQLPPDPVAGGSPFGSKLHARARRVQRRLRPPQRRRALSFAAARRGGIVRAGAGATDRCQAAPPSLAAGWP